MSPRKAATPASEPAKKPSRPTPTTTQKRDPKGRRSVQSDG
ncbi:MAG TPA: hypothetical protein VGK16_05515 [Candidatus Limnocylindrales bacterium]